MKRQLTAIMTSSEDPIPERIQQDIILN